MRAMTRKELQETLKQLRDEGHQLSISLNSATSELAKEWQRIMDYGSDVAFQVEDHWEVRPNTVYGRPYHIKLYPCCFLGVGKKEMEDKYFLKMKVEKGVLNQTPTEFVQVEVEKHGLTFVKEKGAYSAYLDGACLFSATTLKVFYQHFQEQSWLTGQTSDVLEGNWYGRTCDWGVWEPDLELKPLFTTVIENHENTDAETKKPTAKPCLSLAQSAPESMPKTYSPKEVQHISKNTADILQPTKPASTDRANHQTPISLQDSTLGAIGSELAKRFTRYSASLVGQLMVALLVFLVDLPEYCLDLGRSLKSYLKTAYELETLRLRPRLLVRLLVSVSWYRVRLLWQVRTPVRFYRYLVLTLASYRSLLTGRDYPLIG